LISSAASLPRNEQSRITRTLPCISTFPVSFSILPPPTPFSHCHAFIVQKFVVELDQTCLYPEGGGQPYDMGQLKLDDSKSLPVVTTQRLDDAGPILHFTPEPVEAGVEVTVEVDWTRRFDHMQMHSSQHLISAAFKSKFGFETTSWYLSKYPEECMIELHTPAITPEQLAEINTFVNEQIRNATQMNVHVYENVDKALADPTYQQSLSVGQAKKFPEGLVGPARCIEIPGLEMNACGGTHVDNLSKLQGIVIFRSAAAGKDHTRIFFSAGGRLLKDAAAMKARELQITSLLGAPAHEHVMQLERLQAQLRAKTKELESVADELAELRAGSLATRPLGSETEPRFVVSHREVGGDIKSLQRLGSAFNRAIASQGISRVLVATSAEEGKSADGNVNGVFFVAGPADLVSLAGPLVAAKLGGRGGGARGCFQGKGTHFDQIDAAIAEAEEAVAKKVLQK